MKYVIGYTTFFGDDFLKNNGLTKNELLDSKIELKLCEVGKNNELNETTSDDVLFNTHANNKIKITDFENDIATIMYETPVPENVFNEFKGIHDKPIFQKQ